MSFVPRKLSTTKMVMMEQNCKPLKLLKKKNRRQ